MAAISVVLATFRGVGFVREALLSVFRQTRQPKEIIVVDDCSTDGTCEEIASLATSAPVPLRLTRLARNSGGPAHPLNVGIESATSELIAILDQDDVYQPDYLAKLGGVLERQPELSFAFVQCGDYSAPSCPGHEIQSEEIIDVLRAQGQWQEDHYRVDQRLIFGLLWGYGNFIVGYPGFVFRRQLWQRNGGLDEHLRVASDYDFLRYLCQCGPVGFVPDKLFLRRTHGGNLSVGNQSRDLVLQEFMIDQRFFTKGSWLLENPETAPAVRDRLFDKAAWYRVHHLFNQEAALLRTWSAFDLECPATILRHLRRYSLWHCDFGDYHLALRLLWHARNICGWCAEILNATNAVFHHWTDRLLTASPRTA
jgi:glycosyltransferase involved in cell wall biosynthesis